MERQTRTRRWTKSWWVYALAGLALVALANGVSPLLLGLLLICPLAMAGMHGGHAEHADTSPRGQDGDEHEHSPERKEDGR
jgi:hypothetical protein